MGHLTSPYRTIEARSRIDTVTLSIRDVYDIEKGLEGTSLRARNYISIRRTDINERSDTVIPVPYGARLRPRIGTKILDVYVCSVASYPGPSHAAWERRYP